MGIPKVSGGDIPEPFNENDVYIINALISKFLCKMDIFTREIFIREMIDGYLKPSVGGYPREGLKAALADANQPINLLINYCLNRLTNMGLVKKVKGNRLDPTHLKTSRLGALCRKIDQYDMPFVEGLVRELTDIETEIRNNESYEEITIFLEKLKKRRMSAKDSSLSNKTLAKLDHLGVINLSVNGMISISNIGKVLII